MRLLITFLVLTVMGQAANAAICLVLERSYPRTVSVAVFFALFLVVFWLSWRLAVRLSEPRAKAIEADRQRLLVIIATATQAPMIV
jgi:hypothetical protein